MANSFFLQSSLLKGVESNRPIFGIMHNSATFAELRCSILSWWTGH